MRVYYISNVKTYIFTSQVIRALLVKFLECIYMYVHKCILNIGILASVHEIRIHILSSLNLEELTHIHLSFTGFLSAKCAIPLLMREF